MRMRLASAGLGLILLAGVTRLPATPTEVVVNPGADAAERLQEALIEAVPGTRIRLPAGTYTFTRGLSLSVADVTIAGEGMDRTILSYRGQTAGSEGLTVTAGGFVLEDLAIEDAKGDGLKVHGVRGVTVRRVRVEWTGGPLETNGAYGLYPVSCVDVLIENCVAIGASDAGIYVGQSENIIVRHNRAERNVAGIEIENSRGADVYGNTAEGNTGGILVFDLPGLPKKNGGDVRIFRNTVAANNTPNFAPPGNIVAVVPPGTGIMVMANDHVEIFENTIKDHRTINLAIVSFQIAALAGRAAAEREADPEYVPFSEAVYVHDNRFEGGGDGPSGPIGAMVQALIGAGPVPDILYDGAVDPQKRVEGRIPEEWGIWLENNGDADFINLNLADPAAGPIRDVARHTGKRASLPGITIPGVK